LLAKPSFTASNRRREAIATTFPVGKAHIREQAPDLLGLVRTQELSLLTDRSVPNARGDGRRFATER
jgi:hypothetical protein